MKPTLLLILALGFGAGRSLIAGTATLLAAGLVVTEYPRHELQANDKHSFIVPVEKLGEPVGQKYIVKSLTPWKWNSERNAVARGFLEIAEDGDYRFTTRSFYDRNLLMIDDKVVCAFGDGDETVAKISLKKGRVRLLSAGFVGGRGASGIEVRWQPPSQSELSAIPPHLLKHFDDGTLMQQPQEQVKLKQEPRPVALIATHLITVTDDFVVEAYKNSLRIKGSQRKLLDEIHGATVERMSVDVRAGDWLVFHVVNNHLRWGGAKYFAAAGCLGMNEFGFVSDPSFEAWSVCDDPSRVRDFIRQRDEGTDIRAGAIAKPWAEGDDHMRKHAGAGFPGKALWGGGGSTWIKFVAPQKPEKPIALPSNEVVPVKEVIQKPTPAKPAPKAMPNPTR